MGFSAVAGCSDVPQGIQWEEKQLTTTPEFRHKKVGA